ncbi:GDSL esterase/lipase At1g29670-like [Olea europaea var. sylvestris]|uniref:GDSL esterase/lipase At1g29670-like n=1 Tax=Olea europaea var. sylvestris TaxID=158386 RepID=UPI000C1D40C4|nr:GDSL esterase/lipase At1g29670-like [Olea europaea var. sylvestris]
MKSQKFVKGEPLVPCLFFMGDSLFDNGNNNFLSTMAKSNYPPYGIDYPDGPTGRFSNGRNIADFLAQLLGFDNPIPPFVSARGSKILRGVNYASGAAGIREESGFQVGDRISLNRQLLNHRTTISRFYLFFGRNVGATKDYLNKCLYIVNMGNNDYINNYFLPQYYSTSLVYTPHQFATILIRQYSEQLRTLYSYGARKIAIFGLGLLGCIPQELTIYPPTKGSLCVEPINNAVQLFNNRLKPMIDDLNNNLSDAKFIYINITSISLGDPSAIGIKVVNVPCCIVSTTFANGQCAQGKVPCNNRNQYVFYDNFHPTEILNFVTATRAYNATLPSDAYPTDISHLALQ